MAHKTLVNGTAYDITGGMTLVEGTSYSIKGGKTLIGGTEYDISFALPAGVLDLFGSSSSGSGINCITYADGYWVVGGRCYDGTNYYAALPTQPVLMARGRHGICGAALTLLIPSTVSPTQMATGQLADAAIMETI